jgi:pimeloyl-ACP methyl ester carboxylesterase
MSTTPNPPVLFIHGLWIHSDSWTPWINLFAERGYTAIAPGWPGDAETVEATRAHPEALDGIGIEAIFDRYADIIEAMEQKPIVIGHSFGGLIAQELLAHDLAVAAVAIDPAPIKGVKALPFAQLRSGFPVLGNLSSKKHTVSLTEHQFRYSFGNAVTEEESNELHSKFAIPGPGRPLFEDAGANFSRTSPAAVDTHKTPRGPLLLTSGSLDHTVPEVVTKEVFKLYTDHTDSITDFIEFEGRGHSLAFDSGWADVAGDVLAWLDEKVATGATRRNASTATV